MIIQTRFFSCRFSISHASSAQGQLLGALRAFEKTTRHRGTQSSNLVRFGPEDFHQEFFNLNKKCYDLNWTCMGW